MAKRLSVLEPVSNPDTNATYLKVKFDSVFTMIMTFYAKNQFIKEYKLCRKQVQFLSIVCITCPNDTNVQLAMK